MPVKKSNENQACFRLDKQLARIQYKHFDIQNEVNEHICEILTHIRHTLHTKSGKRPQLA